MTDQRPHSHGDASPEWFEEWFNHPLYLQVYSHRDSSEAALCVDTILRLTGLDRTDAAVSVLDIACGAGRHAIAFARKGLRVSANDLSPFLLDTAKADAGAEGLGIEFTRCDMRSIKLERAFGLIVQLFSSFGYFDTDEEDRQVVGNVMEMLKPGGWYVLDLVNPAWLRRHFVRESEKRAGVLSITEHRELSRDKVVKQITVRDTQGNERTFNESLRLFSREAITELLEREGFEILRITGDYEGNPFNPETSPRLLMFSRKPCWPVS